MVNGDGSCVRAWEYPTMIARSCASKSEDWILGRDFTVSTCVNWDAASTTNRNVNTSMCGRVVGTAKDVNSPNALHGLVHWEGKDDWESTKLHCQPVFDAQALIISNNNKTLVPFPDGSTMTVQVDQVNCADGAALAALFGCSKSFFSGKFPCLWCKCPSDKLHDIEKKWPLKDHTYYNNSSHCPATWPCNLEENFKPFDCPHCKKKFPTLQDVCRDHDNSPPEDSAQAKAYKSDHGQNVHTHYVLSPVERSVACALHVPLALSRHEWSHGIAQYIGGEHGDDIANKVNYILTTKCDVVLCAKKVADGLVQDAARMPRLPGGPARKVCIYFDLILDVVLFPRPELREDKDRQLHFKRASECNDALIELWNCLSQRMPRVEGKAPTLATRRKKARLMGNKGKIFVLKFVAAYGQSAAKPYTHMVTHLEDMQLAVEVTRVAHMIRSGILTLTCAIHCRTT